MNELHLFAGAGGGILGGMLLGHTCVCAVEINQYCRKVLLQRQRDGILPRFPVWDDVTTFDGKPWRGRVDVVCGGFPCQDISAAGNGAGIDGERSGLWREMARVIGEVRPGFVLVENSPMLIVRGLARVLGDLTALGYDCRWGVMGAVDAGAQHKRDRIWIVAHSSWLQPGRTDQRPKRERAWNGSQPIDPHATCSRLEGYRDGAAVEDREPRQRLAWPACGEDAAWWESEPDVGRVAHGVAARVDRLKAIGNGQVPAVAALAFNLLINEP